MPLTTKPGGSLPLGRYEISRVGYGAMQLEHLDATAATALLRRVIELGSNHLDTASFYGDATVNGLIRSALHPYADDVVIVSKVGARWVDAPVPLVPAQQPEELRRQIHLDLKTLGLECLPVANLRRLDQAPGIVATGADVVPLDDQLAELITLRDEGLVGGIGLSSVSAEQLHQALSADIVCVQNGYNLLDRTGEDLLELCNQYGIVWVPYFPLGSALDRFPSPAGHPRVEKIAAKLGSSAAAVSLAWILAHKPNTALIPGTRSVAHLEDNVAAGHLQLSPEDMERLDRVAEQPEQSAS